MIWATVSSQSRFCWLYRASPSLAAKNIINLISVLTIRWCPCVDLLLCCWKRVFAMTSMFSWQNSVSLCPVSLCTPRPSSVQFSCSVVSHSLRPHELQHARPPCPSPTPGLHPNPCPLSRWCHPTISSSVIPFSCPQSFPASGSFPMSQFFASGGQSIRVSASTSVLPMNIQD